MVHSTNVQTKKQIILVSRSKQDECNSTIWLNNFLEQKLVQKVILGFHSVVATVFSFTNAAVIKESTTVP
jgi:hypothetical protein